MSCDTTPVSQRLATSCPGTKRRTGERESAAAVYNQVRAFIDATDGATAKLTRSQKERFVALCWIGQIFKHFPGPKAAYVTDWYDLPSWQKKPTRTFSSASNRTREASRLRPASSEIVVRVRLGRLTRLAPSHTASPGYRPHP